MPETILYLEPSQAIVLGLFYVDRKKVFICGMCGFFDGIGSTIVSLIASAIIGGFTGYKIGIHKKNKINSEGWKFIRTKSNN